MFALYVSIIAAGIVWAIVIGFSRGADDQAAGDTVQRFVAELEGGDARAACNELSANTREELESEEAAECEQALPELDLSLGDVTKVDAAETSATVELSEGGSVYLEETSKGWRITAVGCQPRPAEPDDCEVQA
jgi:hypothetical protein